MTNIASVSSDQLDPAPSDNTINLVVLVQDFSITPQSGSLTLSRGGSVSETLTFGAQGGLTGNLDLECAVSGPAPVPACGISPSPGAAGSSASLPIHAS